MVTGLLRFLVLLLVAVALLSGSFNPQQPHAYSSTPNISPQSPSVSYWSNYYAQQGLSDFRYQTISYLQGTADNGVIIIATLNYGQNGERSLYWVMKLDSNGNVVWQQAYQANMTNEQVFTAIASSDGGYLIVGNYATYETGFEHDHLSLLKLSSTGAIEWQRAIDGEWSVRYVTQTADGDYVVFAFLRAGFNYMFVTFTMDANGYNIVQQQSAMPYDVDCYDCANSIQPTSDGGAVILYSSTNIMKLNASYQISWDRSYQIPGGSLASLRQTSDGGYIVWGQYYIGRLGIANYWILKLDASGAVIWQKSYADPTELLSYPESVTQTPDGGYLVLDYSNVMRLDPNGSVMWRLSYNSQFAMLQPVANGDFIAAGGSVPLHVAKVDAEGQIPNCSLTQPLPNLTVSNTTATATPIIENNFNWNQATATIEFSNVTLISTPVTEQSVCPNQTTTTTTATRMTVSYSLASGGSPTSPIKMAVILLVLTLLTVIGLGLAVYVLRITDKESINSRMESIITSFGFKQFAHAFRETLS